MLLEEIKMEEFGEYYGGCGRWYKSLEIKLGEERRLYFYDCTDAPADATLDQAISSAYDIFSLLKEVYELGKDGVELEFNSEEFYS